RFRELITQSDYPISPDDIIELVSYQPNELIYKYKAGGERLAVFSDIYYPAGWKSFIDGAEVPHFRANYVLRGMVVPGGEHEIRFSFEPESFYLGNRISLASSILFILMIVGYIAISIRRNTKKE
ncbi:MAG TPA: YfhO family protein, partial [Bacteroidales bacterium]|nr:YfhO family protein [Bacteroidales bacterium]